MRGMLGAAAAAAAADSMAAAAAAAAVAASVTEGPSPSPEDDLVGTIKGVGVTGSLIYTAMLLFVGWRTREFFRTGGDGAPPGVFPAKTFFHVFLLGSCFCDLPYYYKLGGGAVSKGSYSLHLVAILLDLCAFSMLCVAWSRPLQISRDQDRVLTTVLALDSFVLIYTFVVIALVIISSTDVDHFVASSPQPYLFFFLVHGVALLVFCVWLLAFGVRLQRAIRAHPRWEPVRRERRLRITLRINGVLCVCGACFLLRVALLLVHFLQAEAGDDKAMLAPGAIVAWYLFAQWIPFVLPACTLLLMMRPGATGGVGVGALGGSSPAGPATVGLISSPASGRGLGGAAGAGTGVGLKDWGLDEPLVSPGSQTQPLAAREYLARLQRGNLYSPPASASAPAAAAAAAEVANRGGAAAAAGANGTAGPRSKQQQGGAAILDLGEDGEEEEEEEEEDSGVDAERKDERTTAAVATGARRPLLKGQPGKGQGKGKGKAMPPKQLDVEAV